MFNNCGGCYFKQYVLPFLLVAIFFSLPHFSVSHEIENPSIKYSREANENFKKINDNHDHGKLHIHDKHGHDHIHSDDGQYEEKQKFYKYDSNEIWLSIGSTLLISAAPFMLLPIISLDNSAEMRPRLKVLLAFASGGLLGDAFLHLIPHAASPHHMHDHSHEHFHGHSDHDHSKGSEIGLWVLGGIIVFLVVEKVVRLLKGGEHHSHGHGHGPAKKNLQVKQKKCDDNSVKKKSKEEQVEISGYLNLAADFAHNFTDGLAIGASYSASKNIGLITTITILLHEVPHEIGDFAILIKSGCTRRKAMLLQLVTALGALAGNILALIGVGTAPWILPFTAGGFIYIATVSVLPELLEESTKLYQSIKEIAALLIGVLLMVFIANFE